MPLGTLPSTGVTPGRSTRLELDLTETVLYRSRWEHKRKAADMGRFRTNLAGSSRNVYQIGSQAWIIQPTAWGAHYLERATFEAGIIKAPEVNMAPLLQTYNSFRSPATDQLGVTVNIDILGTGIPLFRKEVPAGSSWDSSLSADVISYPGPTLDTQDVLMDRVIAGKTTYPARQSYIVAIDIPGHVSGVDNIGTFYFGGPVDTDPPNQTGGEFALNIRGDKQIVLYERTNFQFWTKRASFQGPEEFNKRSRRTIMIYPLGRNTIVFDFAVGFSFLGLLALIQKRTSGQKLPDGMAIYTHNPAEAGYSKLREITGPGPVRFDQRRDLREAFLLARDFYQPSGTLIDGPFSVPHSLPESTLIKLTLDADVPPGTSLDVTLYNAGTASSLPAGPDPNTFLSDKGLNHCYTAFDFAASADNTQTPVLRGFKAVIEAGTVLRTGTNVHLPVRSVTVTGPDLAPDHETAHVEITNDVTDQGTLLRTRGRIPARITTTYNDPIDSTKRTVLFHGEIARARPKKKGRPRRRGLSELGETVVYPSPNWHQYSVDLVGRWARLADQLTLDLTYFDVDEDAPENAQTGLKPPYKITDIIKKLLGKCGVPDDEMDIPDNPLRLWPTEQSEDRDNYLLQPTVAPTEFLQRLCEKYLGQVLLFDPNAGPRGMWRLLDNKVPPYVPIYNFTTGTQTPGAIPYAVGSLTSRVREWSGPIVKAPEANLIVVVGAGGFISNDGGQKQLVQVLWNGKSYSPDPATPTATDETHPDFLGREVPLIYVDFSLTTQQHVDFVCRRLYDQVAHAQTWYEFYAPLVVISDTGDAPLMAGTGARPLRINDPVGFDDKKLLLRSVNPDIARSDRLQYANYEGLKVA